MCFKTTQAAIDCQAELHQTERLVLIILARHLNSKTGECYPQQTTVARRAGINREQVNRIIKNLQTKGLIEKIRIPGRRSRGYRFNLGK
jgi:DNA-binding MarR family transcriptional regulator